MKVQVTGPETVPSFEQLQPVAAGVFDFGLTTGGYYGATSFDALSISTPPSTASSRSPIAIPNPSPGPPTQINRRRG